MNYLQTLSGTATRARRYADAVAGLPVRVLDTRKTIPGLRLPQKYAVRCGGCHNHRMGLYDAILIKENHILAAGSIAAALAAARDLADGLPVEIEVENLAELEQALAAGATHLLLDNFPLEALRQAVGSAPAAPGWRPPAASAWTVCGPSPRPAWTTSPSATSTKDLVSVDLSMRFLKP